MCETMHFCSLEHTLCPTQLQERLQEKGMCSTTSYVSVTHSLFLTPRHAPMLSGE